MAVDHICANCEFFERDDKDCGFCLNGRAWRFERTERWNTLASDSCEYFEIKRQAIDRAMGLG